MTLVLIFVHNQNQRVEIVAGADVEVAAHQFSDDCDGLFMLAVVLDSSERELLNQFHVGVRLSSANIPAGCNCHWMTSIKYRPSTFSCRTRCGPSHE